MENKVNNFKVKFINKFKNEKKFQYLVIILIIVLILGGYFLFSTFSKKDTAKNVTYSVVNDLENRLKDTLNKVEGAGKVEVVINVESEMETVLAMKTTITENSNGKVVEETPIIVNGEPIVLKKLYPQIIGVLIVAEGADNIVVYRKLQQATTSLLDVNVNKIEILKMK